MATNIPPHNLTEIVNACIMLVNHPNATLDDVMKSCKGPDFPTGGFIYGRSGIKAAYQHGRGRFMMRARARSTTSKKDRQAIIVTEIPYQVNKARLIERIAELVNDKIIDDIGDIRDESDRDGMRIVIELKRGAEPQIVLNQLYKHTQMQESFSMIFLAVVNGNRRRWGWCRPSSTSSTTASTWCAAAPLTCWKGTRPRAHPRRLPACARQHRRRDPHDPRQRRPRRSAEKLLA